MDSVGPHFSSLNGIEAHMRASALHRRLIILLNYRCSYKDYLALTWVMLCAALLTVNDDKFWEGVMPVYFGGMPAVQDKLAVMGYPNGKFSMTTPCVSRVSMVKFQWSQTELLGVKVKSESHSTWLVCC